jgi:divalent metal cation (Fe/Co/Zn/Cd) transporter
MPNHKTARTFLWFSLILLLVGAAVGDPTASFAVMVLAGLSALVTIVLGRKWLKLIGLLALVIAIFLGQTFWTGAKEHQNQYLERARTAAAMNQTPDKTTTKP